MTPLFPAQRAAEEFDQVLGGTATHAVADRYADLLDTVVMLREQPDVLPRAEFVGDLRARLMTAAETELVPAPSVVRQLPQTRTPRARRRFGTIAASLVIVGGSAGMAAAASEAMPGEALYPIKRGVEQASTAVHLSDAGKGRSLLEQASTRLDEVQQLQRQGSPDAALVATTLDAFGTAAESGSARLFEAYADGGSAQDISTVRDFTAAQMADIASLSGTSATTDESLVDAADTLADIDQQARALCPGCGPNATLQLPDELAAGAGAATAKSLLARPAQQAQADLKRAEDAEKARLAQLQALAEESAGEFPTASGGPTAGSGTLEVPKVSSPDGRVSSQLTPEDGLVPTLTSGTAVKDLVSGVTGNVPQVTSGVTGGDTPVDDVVEGVTGTVDGLSDGLTDGLLADE
jgi:hypothetical protein